MPGEQLGIRIPIPVAFAVAKLAFHAPLLARYGVHRDELYFMACGERLDWGYADHAPIVPWLAAMSRAMLGGSWLSLRVLALLAGAAAILVTGLLVRRLGGGRFAQALACLAMLITPVFLRTANQFSIPSFEPLVWTSASFVLVSILQGGDPRRWLLFGAITGVGLLVKHTMLLYGASVVVGLLLTQHRRHLRSPWLWAGGALAAAIFSPNLVWQAQHGWATLAFIANLNAEVMQRIPRYAFLLGQIIYLHPLNVIVWIAGLVHLLRTRPDVRPLGIAYLFMLAALLVLQSKVYYSAPIYPTLLAAGGVAWERFAAAPRRAWTRPAVLVVLVVTGAATAPISAPILPIQKVDAFAQAVTFGLAGQAHEVTGDLHDMFGWEEQAAAVYGAAEALSTEDRSRLVLLAGNYGEAGALEYFVPSGTRYPVLCPHLSYYLWADEAAGRDVVLALGFDEAILSAAFQDVEQVGTADGSPHANPNERDLPLWLCRRPVRPMLDLWRDVRMQL